MQTRLKNTKLLLIIPLLVLTIIPALPSLPKANALTGNVCLADTTTMTCGATLFAAVGSQLMVRVQISGSDDLNGFDIQIRTDASVLRAADATLSGSILTSGGATTTELVKCFDGVLKAGSTCSVNDGLGVLHYAAVRQGSNVAGNGLLFTAVYDVVAQSASTALGFNTGCTGTSVPNGTCVTIANGTLTPPTETATGATFSNLTDFTIDSSPMTISVAPGAHATSTITLTSFGGYTDFVSLTVAPSAGLTAVLGTDTDLSGGLFLPADSTASTTLDVSAASSGAYTALVTGTGSNPSFTHSVTVHVTVTPQDFTVSANPTSLSIAPGDSATSTITVAGVSGFTGTVTLAATVSPAGPTATLSMTTIPGASGTSLLTVAVPSGTASGLYTVHVTGSGSTGTHSVNVAVNVGLQDFSVSATPDTVGILRIGPTASGGVILNLRSINNFACSVTLSVSWRFAFIDTPGAPTLSFALTPSSTVMINAGQTVPVQFDVFPVKTTTGTGLYIGTVTATGCGRTQVRAVNFWILDFTITPDFSSVTMINQLGVQISVPATIRAIGAPHNQTGDDLNNVFGGAEGGTGTWPTEYGYGSKWTSSTGGLFANALGLDHSVVGRRCFSKVSDSLGNEILPVFTGSSVTSFAAPVVHINGDQDGDPANFNGCRFDSFFFVIPSTPDRTSIVVETLTTTPNGMFTTSVCFQVGPLINCIPLTINIVGAQKLPEFHAFSWNHSPSLAATGRKAVFTARVDNPTGTGQVTLYAQVVVTAVSSDGSRTIVGRSIVVSIAPGIQSATLTIQLDLAGVPAGVTFNFDAQISWGVDPSLLLYMSNNVNPDFQGSQESPTGMSGAFKTSA